MPAIYDPKTNKYIWEDQGSADGANSDRPDLPNYVPPGGAPPAATAQTAPSARYLSAKEQNDIINSIGGHEGWYVIGGAAVPETKLGTDNIGKSVNVPTGGYTINISDGKGHTEPLTIYQGNPDDQGAATWVPSKTPAALPKPDDTTTTPFGTAETGYYARQSDGSYKQVAPPKVPNPDEDRLKAVQTQVAEAQRNERQANEVAGKGYMTDQERIALEQSGARVGQSQQQIDLDKAKFANSQKEFDRTQKLAEAKGQADIVESTARAGQATAQTGQIQTATDIAQQKAGPEIGLLGAQTGAQQASAASSAAQTQKTLQDIAQGKAPTTTAATLGPTSMYVAQTDPNTGALSYQINPSFQPKTQADVAGLVSDLQTRAAAERDRLANLQRSGSIDGGQAASQFDSWWNQNVEPRKSMLEAASRSAQLEEQKAQQEQQRANLATAQGAGTQAIQAMQAQLPYMVGPGFGQAANQIAAAYSSGKAPGPIDIGSAVTFQMPDIQQLAADATNQALAHISPTAAQNMGGAGQPMIGAQLGGQPGQPGPGGMPQQPMDVTSALNRTNYAPGSTTVTVGPNGTTQVTSNQGQPNPQQLAAQNAAGGQVTNIGAFSGTNPAASPAWRPPSTYGPFAGAMPTYTPSF
jgi:hypothetical protein